ncbi:hypothetical protein [Nonomuraea roseola]|uniref:Uncharacterized protein n=1 Tax=Nonomuraea roseola TaxID=46179 RepID=A0ABV5QDU4_9ACTN
MVGGEIGEVGGAVQNDDAVNSLVRISAPRDETGLPENTTDADVARSWTAIYETDTGPRPWRVFALCSATSDAIVEETTFRRVPGFDVGTATAKCPAGRRAVGGGVSSTDDRDSGSTGWVQASGPRDEAGRPPKDGDVARAWYAIVNGVGTFTGVTFKVFALCATDGAT